MDNITKQDLKRLEEQVFSYRPNIKSIERKRNVSNRLRNQLLETIPVVKIQRMDAQCESLMNSLKQRLMLLQDFLIPKSNQVLLETINEHKEILNSSSEFSDDELLSTLISQQKEEKQKIKTFEKSKEETKEIQQADTSDPLDSHIPLALRRKPRKRKLSYKSYSSASTSHSKSNYLKLHSKQEHNVSSSGVTIHSEEMVVEQEEVDATPTLHIKIPSLHRGNVHYIILDSLNFARKNVDYRANEIKQQQQQNAKSSKPHTKQIKCSSAPILDRLTHQEQEFELSQLIEDVMAEACGDETLQATTALENINKNLIENYGAVESFESLQELPNSHNLNTNKSNNLRKKSRKNSKTTSEPNLNEPPKKRGRKPKQRNYSNNSAQFDTHLPTKSNLAKYVEHFSNDCELLPGSSTPAASSTRSQPLVSSTTHNFEALDQLPTQSEQQTSTQQQPIMYYIDGDWANGGPCQLIQTSGLTADGKEINQDDMNAPFHDFVNYIDNSGDSCNNVIARDLEYNNSLPISIPLTIASLGLQNKNQVHTPPHQIHQQSSVQNSLVPIINIQIPTLPKNIIGPSAPPPAHNHKEVLDLSLKSKTNISTKGFNLNQYVNNNLDTPCFTKKDVDYLPLDLSVKDGCAKDKASENNCVTIDTQDEDFIRCLIEQSEFNYSEEKLKKDGEVLAYDHHKNKSFKAALDMPILDFDTSELAQLVENTTAIGKNEQNIITGDTNVNSNCNLSLEETVFNSSPSNADSNYVSMTAADSSIENDLHISNQSTTEMFNKLLDICPENQFLNDVNNEFVINDYLNESHFVQSKVKNSTMCEVKNLTTEKNDIEEENGVCNTFLAQDNQKNEHTSSDEPTSSSALAVYMYNSNTTADNSVDMSLSLKISAGDSNDFKKAKVLEVINLKNSAIVEANNVACSNSQQCSIKNKNGTFIETTQNDENYQDKNKVAVGNSKTVSQFSRGINDNNDETLLNASIHGFEKNYGNVNDNSPNTVLKKDEIFKAKDLENSESNINNMEDRNANCILLSKREDSSAFSLDSSELLQDLNYVNSKTKENFLYSMSKITSSEESNLYSTDSDTSSGKSFKLTEFKKMKTDVDIEKIPLCYNIEHTNSSDNLTNISTFIEKLMSPRDSDKMSPVEENVENKTAIETEHTYENSNAKLKNFSVSFEVDCENDKEISNNCKYELKKLQNVENNFNQEQHNDLESAKVQTVKDAVEDNVLEKDLDISKENLTLLELESKLDNSLDFEEDFDDAMSLATSCFASPIDERFGDSVHIDGTDTTNTLQNFQHDNCHQILQNNDLKHFKIPKIRCNSIDSNSGTISTKQEEIISGNSMAKITLTTNEEKITRTVKNDLVQLNTKAEVILAGNDLKTETSNLEKVAHNVFGINCLPYLVDKCYNIIHCQLHHELNDTDKLYAILNTLDKTEVNLAYQVMYNHSKLFKVYFEAFCIYYSTKNDRLKLLNMANDCERYPEHAKFIIAIYEALVECGLGRINACRLLLKRFPEKVIDTSTVEALVAIIIKSDWTMFTNFIEKYTEDMYKFNFRIGTLEQMAPAVLNSKGTRLKQIFGKCVQTLHRDDTGLLSNYPLLIQCVALLTKNTE